MHKALNLLVNHLDNPIATTKAAKDLMDAVRYTADTAESGADRKPGIHPSSLSRCLRQAWMELVGAPRMNTKVPEAVRRAGTVGKALHKIYQDQFHSSAKTVGYKYLSEVGLDHFGSEDAKRLSLEGRSDGLLLIDTPDRVFRVGHEFKGASKTDYAAVGSSRRPMEMHLLQASVYQHCLGMDAMWFIYISRESFTDLSIVLKIPETYWDTMRRRAITVMQCEIKDQAPPGTEDVGACQICAYTPCCPEPRGSIIKTEEVWKWAKLNAR